jgi:hypothetical protein
MHAWHFFDPHHHHQFLVGLLVLAVALVLMAAAAPELGSLDLSLGGGGDTADPATDASPTWTTDPMRPPVEILGGR